MLRKRTRQSSATSTCDEKIRKLFVMCDTIRILLCLFCVYIRKCKTGKFIFYNLETRSFLIPPFKVINVVFGFQTFIERYLLVSSSDIQFSFKSSPKFKEAKSGTRRDYSISQHSVLPRTV